MAPPRDGATGIVILAGGAPLPGPWLPPVADDAWIVAADSGLALMPLLGRDVDLVVGDLDSVDQQLLARARAAGSEVVRHPVDKDRTDLALALDAALERAPADVLVLGGYAGRLDHLLGNALLLASERYRSLRLVARVGRATVTVVHDETTLHGEPGELVSLLPVHGPAQGVTTTGLRFPLDDDALPAGSSRGVSNRFVAHRATVRVGAGPLLAVQPGPDPTDERTE